MKNIDVKNLTPMLKQYIETKKDSYAFLDIERRFGNGNKNSYQINAGFCHSERDFPLYRAICKPLSSL